MNKYFIIDFDSTFVRYECLDKLAEIVLEKNPKKEIILKKIKEITRQGMEGKIPFEESLSKRLQLIKIHRNDLNKLSKLLQKSITPSILRNKKFFKKYRQSIYIISGGFEEFVHPVTKKFYLSDTHVIANKFCFNKKGYVMGFDKNNPLAHKNGKVKAIKKLNLQGDIIVIGDGYTDFQIKELKAAQKFVAFTENVTRSSIVDKADYSVPSFDEFLYINKLPMIVSYPKNRIKVLLLENVNEIVIQAFEQEGYEVKHFKNSLDEKELADLIRDIHILGIRSRTNVNKNIINSAPKLLSIGTYCIGTDQVDLKTATSKGICVYNAPYSNTRSVVELVIGEIIMLSRGIIAKNDKLHKGIWDKSAAGAHEIRGKTLGIIGYGNIGSQLSVLAENLGMKVCFYDIADKLALGNAENCLELNDLLKQSDFITVHIDGNSRNKNFISEKEFTLMKQDIIFLNLSRGFVVNLKALTKYIKNGKVKGAAIDVFPNEPKSEDKKFVSDLKNLPNVILTPHIGGSTEEAQKNIGEYVTGKIIDYMNSGNTNMSVNIPNIHLPRLKNAHRLLHLHNNVPGILAQINNILAKNKINILGQYLKTNDQLGYVITDVNKKYNREIVNQLKEIDNTIKFRILY